MVGRLTPERRGQVVDLLSGLARHDEAAMLDVLLDWRGEDAVDEAQLAADLGELAFDYADVPLKDLRIAALLQRVAGILREHGIVLPADLTLMFKALMTLEGLGRQYDPSSASSSACSRCSSGRCASATSPLRCWSGGAPPSASSGPWSARCRAILPG